MLAIVAEAALRSLAIGGLVWAGLHVLRVRNPHLHMMSWLMVLLASLAMPFLMHWTTVTIALDAPPLALPQGLWPAQLSDSLATEMRPQTAGGVPSGEITTPVDWWTFDWRIFKWRIFKWRTLATVIYGGVAGLLLLRLSVGLGLTWRLVSAARPIAEPWAAAGDVRVSDKVGSPVTFGSIIVLPAHYIEWEAEKRQAVLAHESAHVAHGDFYVLLLAQLNRAIFWFSPLPWWHLARLAELAELISDARALQGFADRLFYAEVLLDLVQHTRRAPVALGMARATTVRARVERILDNAAAPTKACLRKRVWTAVAIVPIVLIAAGNIAYQLPSQAPLRIEAEEALAAAPRAELISFYSFGSSSIFSVFHEQGDLYGQLTGERKVLLTAERDGFYSYPAAYAQLTLSAAEDPQQPLVPILTKNKAVQRGVLIGEKARHEVEPDTKLLDSYVGWYELSPYRALSITREGDRMLVQETGRPKFVFKPYGADAFYGNHSQFLLLLRDKGSVVSRLVLQEPQSGARLASRISAERAKTIEDAFAWRIAQVPDRFRDQTPVPGGKDEILRRIEQLRRGEPDYATMSAGSAARTRREVERLKSMFEVLGAIDSIFFRGVAQGGYDIYGLKFAHGFGEVRLLLALNGQLDDFSFRPDGDGSPGAVMSCSDGADLKLPPGRHTPINMTVYNTSGADIQLSWVDRAGKRVPYATTGNNMTAVLQTYLQTPWVVTDVSGQCLEMIMPGERTRGLLVERSVDVAPPEQPAGRRSTPQAGSDAMLRQYIEAVRRGEPDYDRMSTEVAAWTRQDLPLRQALLNRLGPLRALTFRGVTNLGADQYIAHFANGAAEWRIALAQDDVIVGIGLGP